MFPSERLEEKNLFLKKIVILFKFWILRKQFLAPCHKNFVKNVKNGFYASNGPFWSKKVPFENRLIFETSSYIEQKNISFLSKVFRRGRSSSTLCFCWKILRKKLFLKKPDNFLYLFWTLVEQILVFCREHFVGLSK